MREPRRVRKARRLAQKDLLVSLAGKTVRVLSVDDDFIAFQTPTDMSVYYIEAVRVPRTIKRGALFRVTRREVVR